MEKYVLRITGTKQYIVQQITVVFYGYQFEATRFDDYEAAFGAAERLMGIRNIKLEIEPVAA